MITVYILPVERIDNTDQVLGIDYIHHALLTYDAGEAVLVQDTTPEEDAALAALAVEVRDPTRAELIAFSTILPEPKPSPAPLVFKTYTYGLPDRVKRIENFLKKAFP